MIEAVSKVSPICKWSAVAIALGMISGISLEAHAARRVALVVGVDAYDNLSSEKQLRKAVADARAVGETLTGLGFEVTPAEDVRRADFNRHWQRFLNALSPGDTAALFFSGHGVQIGGLNYLLPRDVPAVQGAEEDLLKSEAIALQRLLDDLRARAPQVSLVILDACRNNPFTDPRGKSVGGSKGLARVDPPEGTFVMFAAGAGETALDRLSDTDPEVNSVFTRSLLPLLRKSGLTLQETAVKVRDEVRALAARIAHKQTPAYYDEVAGGPVCLAGPCGARRDLAVEPAPRPGAADAAREWERIDKSSAAELRVFIERHGASPEAAYARSRLAALDTGAPAPSPPARAAPQIRTTVVSAGIDDDPDNFVRTYRVRLALRIENLSDVQIGFAVFDRGRNSTFMGEKGERCDDGNRSDAVTGVGSGGLTDTGPPRPESFGGSPTPIAAGGQAIAHVSLECHGPFRSATGSLTIPGYIVLPDRVFRHNISLTGVLVR